MNFFHVILISYVIGVAWAVGRLGQSLFGSTALIASRVIGSIGAIASLWLIYLIVRICERKLPPSCNVCCCRGPLAFEKRDDDQGVLYICPCGAHYLDTGQHFQRVDQTGGPIPYMRRGRFGLWVDDTRPQSALFGEIRRKAKHAIYQWRHNKR